MPYADSAGTRIYWEEEGSGDPVLLIMGLGYPLDMWHRTRPVLAKHFWVILFDNRGVGKSEMPPGPYSIAQMAVDAASVLDAAGVHSAHIVGISMGGMIAQEFALTYPHRVRKLVLGCTACGGPKAVRAEKDAIDLLLAREVMTPAEAMNASIPFIYDAGTPRERIEGDFAIRRRKLTDPKAYAAQLAGILAWESYSRLSAMDAPTLVLHGETDRLVPPGNSRLIAEHLPGAKLVFLPAASHIFTTDQPELANNAIIEFLRTGPAA